MKTEQLILYQIMMAARSEKHAKPESTMRAECRIF